MSKSTQSLRSGVSAVRGTKDVAVATDKGGKANKGVTNDALKSMGRNLARVANQKRG